MKFLSVILLQIVDAIENEKIVNKNVNIYNVDRAVCGHIAGLVAKKYGDTGFAGQLNITCFDAKKFLLSVPYVIYSFI